MVRLGLGCRIHRLGYRLPNIGNLQGSGSSIVRDLEPGKLFVGDKHFDIKIRTKHGASIKQLTHMANNNWIDQHFNRSSHAIISIGSIDMKHINSDKAIELLNQLIQTLKRKHQHIKPTFVTIPPVFDPNLKPSLQGQLNNETDDFNQRLLSLSDIDIINCKFTRNMLHDGIHLNDLGTRKLTEAIDVYLKNCILQ
ncbi:unnamed protein product [Didymodactylos carnosus]|uniref:Uncharacterized protein n=1 Tax=Didymodactylos carnosus TaxID=1234261 RepID=A0A8S2IPV5_9BILA|nr:unnamed protein product [Didymodactylos carnosus]CAF3771989.1 unnamed protein product [Didymodactylos carnosus]